MPLRLWQSKLRKQIKIRFCFIGSPHASVEENYVLMRLSNLLAGSTPVFTPHITDGAGDDFLLSDDQAPNTNGCRLLGLDELTDKELADRIKQS